MLLRKIYLKISLFLYSKRKTLSRIVITIIALTLLASLINNVLVKTLLLGKADNDKINQKYENAINLYNWAYGYYSFNHFSPENKKIYLDIPYKISMCFFAENNKQKSIESMIEGLTSIQKQFGIFSKENAYFIRKYLITYYLDNNNWRLAKKEFDNLLLIYKKIGYTNSELADMIRVAGDLDYYQKKYDASIRFYKQAYDLISVQSDIDYDSFARIVNRICNYKIKTDNPGEAISIYKSSIILLKNSGKEQRDLALVMLLNLGSLYISQNNYNDAISCYEQIISFKLLKNIKRFIYGKSSVSES